ncbi:CHAT domain-containing protein [Allocoleopsis franciscana]|uniref:CHAT domain-containing protein n=1 Tax=Allocoleopsis franciscana PCC 7113 TaxID=1173027 RepID=K9WL89_9CYAN|nr:CHAT domain-containing protein [Allocoleopsis franciscana]AFZ20958.1 hypothetical protein Mic7113_5309 [Allocoleopsis franciscana PCC 7113]
MRTQRIGLIAFLSLLATLAVDNFQFIQNPKSKIHNFQVLAQTPDARKSEADRLGKQGEEQYITKQFEASLQSWQRALDLYREIKDRQGEGAAWGNLGMNYYELRNYPKAIECFQQVLAIARELSVHQVEANSLKGLGLSYSAMGHYSKAIEYYQQILAIVQERKDRSSEGYLVKQLEMDLEEDALNNLGVVYLRLGDYPKALEYYQQNLVLVRKRKYRQAEGTALNNLGVVYLRLGDYPKALEYYQQCLVIAREIREYQQSLAIARERGDYQMEETDLDKRIELMRSTGSIQLSLWLARQAEGVALDNLAVAYLGLGDYPKAIDYTQQSLAIAKDIKDRNGEGLALGTLGLTYLSLGNYAKAIDYQQQSLAIVREVKDHQSEGTVLSNLGYALRKSGNLAAAEKTLSDGIKIWESLRASLDGNDANKVSIFEQQARTYRQLQEVLIAQNKTDAALEIAERGRARALVELVARQLSTNPTEQSPSTPPNIDQIKQIAKAQNSTFVQYSIIYDEFKVQGKQQTKESELYIWVIKPTGEVTFRSSDLKPLWQQQNATLANLVTVARESIGVRGRGLGAIARLDEADQTKRFQQLHQLLIEPIADLLPTDPNAHVVFIPQESLFLVPFPALQGKDGKYLIEKHTILTAPSIQVLELTRKQRENLPPFGKGGLTGDALVVGNPIMPSIPPAPGEKPQPLAPLPGAQEEALAIAPLLNTKAIIGKDATKSTIAQLMPKAQIIHLATHGILDDERGIGSAIALAPDLSYKEDIGTVNGLLTAEEILDMKLNADLVVLSACDTGRGKITGDGVIGLSRSLISAGVPSVLVSLWSVPDAPTAELMREFYQNLLHNPDKAQALRQAMLTTMKNHPNPKNWAAFTLIGESD